MSKPIEKIIYESQLKCPWCSRQIRAKIIRTTITPAVKGETVTEGVFEKDTQTTLEEDYAASLTPEERKIALKKAAKLDKKVRA